MDRREFTSASIMALLSGVTITIAGCDGYGDSPSGPTETPGTGNVSAVISANHSHRGTVSSAEIAAGNEITVNIRGDADHPHTVVLSMGDLVTIGNGQSVTKESSTDPSASYGSHSHLVTFNG